MDQATQKQPTHDQFKALLVWCTCPSSEVADRIAQQIVEKRLAACANIIPGVKSVYRWQGKIIQDQECIMMIKTTKDQFDALAAEIIEMHPYELPELITVNIDQGLEAYLQWIEDQVG